MADIAQLPVAHGHTQWNLKGSRDLRLLRVAMVLVLLYYILHYYYSKKKTLETVAHAHAITSVQGMFRSGPLPVT